MTTHLVFHREFVALALHPRSVDEDPCVCLEPSKRDADVIVDLMDFSDGACVLQLGRGLFFDTFRLPNVADGRSVRRSFSRTCHVQPIGLAFPLVQRRLSRCRPVGHGFYAHLVRCSLFLSLPPPWSLSGPLRAHIPLETCVSWSCKVSCFSTRFDPIRIRARSHVHVQVSVRREDGDGTVVTCRHVACALQKQVLRGRSKRSPIHSQRSMDRWRVREGERPGRTP